MDKEAIITERIKGIEERIENLKTELTDSDSIAEGLDMRINKIEKARPCKTVQAIQKQIIDFFPEQQRTLKDILGKLDKLFQMFGKIENQVKAHDIKIESLESFASEQSEIDKKADRKYQQWKWHFAIATIIFIGCMGIISWRPELDHTYLFRGGAAGSGFILFGDMFSKLFLNLRGTGKNIIEE